MYEYGVQGSWRLDFGIVCPQDGDPGNHPESIVEELTLFGDDLWVDELVAHEDDCDGHSSSYVSFILILTGNNYHKWEEELELHLDLHDLYLTFREPKPGHPTNTSTAVERTNPFTKWINANRNCIMIVKNGVPKFIRGNIEIKHTSKEFLDAIKARFELNKKAEIITLMNRLMNTRYDGSRIVREYILGATTNASKLKDLGIQIDEEYIVHIALNTIPSQYKVILTTYIALKKEFELK
ncbi:uncharacterized protein LOC122057952 [Macadamia integrifolia]|uniref:uncharacterized protein LOC122057952 n=1 Tax=Macadamia integrifolia TaxID=60698 RepID=UPI001C528FEE|nr:uncharacterized protein LOC122057952 [Macadamia integrifolia]